MTAVPHQPLPLGTPEKPSTWPTVIGIIAIVFGSLAILQNGICTPVGLLMSGAISSMMGDLSDSTQAPGMEMQVAQLEAVTAYLPYTLASALAAAAIAVVLLVGGVQLVKRKQKSRATIMVWAVLKMVLALPTAYLTYLSSRAQFEAMAKAAEEGANGPGQVPAGIFSLLEKMGGAGAVFTFAWLWVLPIFMLIWFARRPIQDEIRDWSTSAAGELHDQVG